MILEFLIEADTTPLEKKVKRHFHQHLRLPERYEKNMFTVLYFFCAESELYNDTSMKIT